MSGMGDSKGCVYRVKEAFTAEVLLHQIQRDNEEDILRGPVILSFSAERTTRS